MRIRSHFPQFSRSLETARAIHVFLMPVYFLQQSRVQRGLMSSFHRSHNYFARFLEAHPLWRGSAPSLGLPHATRQQRSSIPPGAITAAVPFLLWHLLFWWEAEAEIYDRILKIFCLLSRSLYPGVSLHFLFPSCPLDHGLNRQQHFSFGWIICDVGTRSVIVMLGHKQTVVKNPMSAPHK